MADKQFNQEDQSRPYRKDWEREEHRSGQGNDWTSQPYRNAGSNSQQGEGQYYGNSDQEKNRNMESREQQYRNDAYTSGFGYGNRMNEDAGKNHVGYGNANFNDQNWNQRQNEGSFFGNADSEDDWARRQRQQQSTGYQDSNYGQQEWNRGNQDTGYNQQWNNSWSGSGNNSGRLNENNRNWDSDRYANSNRSRRDNDWWDRTKDRLSNRFNEEDNRGSRDYTNTHRGKGPANYRRSEDRIREDICDRLTDDDRVDASGISVQIENEVVILSGTVGSREEKRRAEDLVESVSGVRDVENRLRVGGNVLASHDYTGNTDMTGGIGTQSGTTNEIIRDVQNEREGDVASRKRKND